MTPSILTVPHEVLRRKSLPIERLTEDMHDKIDELKEAMKKAHNPDGIGLSFPQIGYNLRGFVTYLEKSMKVYLNPEIIDMSEETTLGGTPDRPTLEGCLSIPWIYGPVPRAKKIKIKAMDERGHEFTKTLSSFPARLALHEYDHLDGILFTDYTLRQSLPLYFLDREHDQFVEIAEPQSVVKW